MPTFEEAVHHSRLRLQDIGTNLNKINEQLKCSANVRDIAMSDIGAPVHCSAYETHNTTLQKSVDERFALLPTTDNQRHLSGTSVSLPFGIPETWPTCGSRVGGKD
jgi:hypothetical protein